MKNQKEFLMQQQRLSNGGNAVKRNSFHISGGDLSWEKDGEIVS